VNGVLFDDLAEQNPTILVTFVFARSEATKQSH
jgi:hypothetical protein